MLKQSLLVITLFLSSVLTLADLNGKWQGTVKTPDGNEYEVSYNFKVDGEKLTGSVTTQWGENPILDGKVTGDEFSFVQTINEMQINHSGRAAGDSLFVKIQRAENPALEAVFKRSRPN